MTYRDQVEKTYKTLEKRAKEYNPIYYGELYKMIDLDHNNVEDRNIGAEILGEVNEISGADYLLSSFAVSKGGNGPIKGYYSLAEELGRIPSGLSEDEKQEFWIEEMKRVRDKFRKDK